MRSSKLNHHNFSVELLNSYILRNNVNHFSVENRSQLLKLIPFSFSFFYDVNHLSVENRSIIIMSLPWFLFAICEILESPFLSDGSPLPPPLCDKSLEKF